MGATAFQTAARNIDWPAAGDNLFEAVMENEEKDLWRSFLERGDYASAARYASTQVGCVVAMSTPSGCRLHAEPFSLYGILQEIQTSPACAG
jgi:hypothetical protein